MAEESVILKEIYPKVQKALSTPKILKKYRDNIGDFINNRSKELYDTAPYTRIYWTDNDKNLFFALMEISEQEVSQSIKRTYYGQIPSFNPRCAKDEFTITELMCIRYFMMKNMKKELEMSLIYLSFSGSFYPSIHYGSFPKVQPSEYRHVMEYVINNELTQKFDLKREGTVIGAIKSISVTWEESYKSKLKSCSDEDVVYVIQQLHNRIKSFMKNIAELYYKIYDNKDTYLSYASDSSDDENFRVADSDSLKYERYISKAMNYITTNDVSYKFCKMAADSNVKTDELKAIITSIQNDSKNMGLIKELITILVVEYFNENKSDTLVGYDFITFAIASKPNTKNKNILRQKQILEQLLCENSIAYTRRKNRKATQNSYYKTLLVYYTLVTNNANK